MPQTETSDRQSLLKGRDEPHSGDERDYDPAPADPPEGPPSAWPDDTEDDVPE